MRDAERRELATRQRQVASELPDSSRRSSLWLAAVVLDPDDESEATVTPEEIARP
jgi:hypothetical protein